MAEIKNVPTRCAINPNAKINISVIGDQSRPNNIIATSEKPAKTILTTVTISEANVTIKPIM